jgi:uncharacterized protein with NRDE domain
MCLLALFYRVATDAPVVVGANREEAYARGGELPRLLHGACRFVAGVDPVAGGTWLGVNELGVLVAVTNRSKSKVPEQPRSRGLLARDLLGCPTAKAAADQAALELGHNRYAGCNFLCADAAGAYVLHAGDWLRVRPLPPGLHVLTARDVNDADDPRLGYALAWLSAHLCDRARDCMAALQELCAQTGNGSPAICLRGDKGGTVSSSIIALRQPLAASTYLHSQGPPCSVAYEDVSPLMKELASGTQEIAN